MYFPPFLKKGSTIGIFAPSAGIDPAAPEGFDCSLSHLRAAGFITKETGHVRTGNLIASSAKTRAAEFHQLLQDKETDMALCAAGGDFLISMLPDVDFDAIAKGKKWVCGYSDPTGLLFPITTRLDIATIYGMNAGSFDMTNLHPSLQNSISVFKGEIPVQHSFALYEAEKSEWERDGYKLNKPVYWVTPNGPVNVTGRLIGGCIDLLLELIGTPYAPVPEFAEHYKKDGLLWYFDVFSITAEELYRTLWHMQQAGWFRYAKGFLFGRVCIPSSFVGQTYQEAVRMALGDKVPVVMDMDIGHVRPSFTLINGAMASVYASDGTGEMQQWLDTPQGK